MIPVTERKRQFSHRYQRESTMKNSNVLACIKLKLGTKRASMYSGSAHLFNAEFETNSKNCYFIESSTFECRDGSTLPTIYKLKYIGTSVLPVKEFKSKKSALYFWENMEFTKTGALVIERSLVHNQNAFVAICNSQFYNTMKYNNGYTALAVDGACRSLLSYCEGDLCYLHCSDDAIYKKEVAAHVDHYNENEC